MAPPPLTDPMTSRALQKVLALECRAEQAEASLAAVTRENEGLKNSLTEAAERELAIRQALAETRLQAEEALRMRDAALSRAQALTEDRGSFIDRMVEMQQIWELSEASRGLISKAPGARRIPQDHSGLDLASFIAELRHEISRLSEENRQLKSMLDAAISKLESRNSPTSSGAEPAGSSVQNSAAGFPEQKQPEECAPDSRRSSPSPEPSPGYRVPDLESLKAILPPETSGKGADSNAAGRKGELSPEENLPAMSKGNGLSGQSSDAGSRQYSFLSFLGYGAGGRNASEGTGGLDNLQDEAAVQNRFGLTQREIEALRASQNASVSTEDERLAFTNALEGLKSTDPNIRRRAAEVLAALSPRSALPDLSQALRNEADDGAASAMAAAISLSGKDAASPVFSACMDTSPYLAARLAALTASARMDESGLSLLHALCDESPQVRRRAVVLAASLQPASLARILESAAADPDASVRHVAQLAGRGNQPAPKQNSAQNGEPPESRSPLFSPRSEAPEMSSPVPPADLFRAPPGDAQGFLFRAAASSESGAENENLGREANPPSSVPDFFSDRRSASADVWLSPTSVPAPAVNESAAEQKSFEDPASAEHPSLTSNDLDKKIQAITRTIARLSGVPVPAEEQEKSPGASDKTEISADESRRKKTDARNETARGAQPPQQAAGQARNSPPSSGISGVSPSPENEMSRQPHQGQAAAASPSAAAVRKPEARRDMTASRSAADSSASLVPTEIPHTSEFQRISAPDVPKMPPRAQPPVSAVPVSSVKIQPRTLPAAVPAFSKKFVSPSNAAAGGTGALQKKNTANENRQPPAADTAAPSSRNQPAEGRAVPKAEALHPVSSQPSSGRAPDEVREETARAIVAKIYGALNGLTLDDLIRGLSSSADAAEVRLAVDILVRHRRIRRSGQKYMVP